MRTSWCHVAAWRTHAAPRTPASPARWLFIHASDVRVMYAVCILLIYLRDGSRRAFTLAARDCGCDCTAGKRTCCHVQKGFSALKLVWDGVMDVSDFCVDAGSAVYPVTGLAPGFYMQLTDEAWASRCEHPCPGDNVSIRPKDTEQVKRLCQGTERYKISVQLWSRRDSSGVPLL